jgi:lipoprotein-releasing system permease protein
MTNKPSKNNSLKLPLKIALRYIFTVRSFHFITVISVISIIGIMIGVAAIICVTSIFNGFREFAEGQLIGFDPHIRISAQQGAWLKNADSLIIKLHSIHKIKASSSMLQGRIVAMRHNSMNVITMNAVKQNQINYVSGIANKVIIGNFDLSAKRGLPGIVIGTGLADKLKALPGDTISLTSPLNIEKAIRTFSGTNEIQTIVTGIFQTNAKEYDESYAFTNADIGESLFNPPKRAAFSIDIRLYSINEVDKVKTEIKSIFPPNVIVQSWYDLHKELYNIMQFERYATFIILTLIVVIAAFNVLASLSMTVVEKKADIGILKAIGATDSLIKKIYVSEGIIIGLFSTFIGTILGLGLCYAQINYGLFRLDSSKFLINAIPVSIHAQDIIIVCIISMLLSFSAALYPAHRASQTIISQAVREE